MGGVKYATEAKARARVGRGPVGLEWIDTNEGSAEVPHYHSRLVCMDVRHNGVEPIIADVRRAHFYDDGVRDVRDLCVRLPNEDPKSQVYVENYQR